MKKIIVFLFCLFVSISTCSAEHIACEVESDTAVSYSVRESSSLEIVYTHYALSDGNSENWIKIATHRNGNKLLHYITLNIDGVDHRLTCVNDVSDKFVYAGSSLIDNSTLLFTGNVHALGLPRYFVLSPELIRALASAKSAHIIYNDQDRLGKQCNFTGDMLNKIKKLSALTYNDFPSYSNYK